MRCAKQGDRVGKIKLAMRVFRAQRIQARPQFLEREAINAGIHFANLALLGRGAFFLDDRQHAAFGVAHDAAVIRGVVEFRAENRGGGFAAAVRIEQSGERLRAQQRRVARKHNRQLRALRIARRATCIACPVPRCGCCTIGLRAERLRQPRPLPPPGGPTTTSNCAGFSGWQARTTCSSSGRPPARCSTLASSERMRVPFPAARMMMEISAAGIGAAIVALR